MKLKYQFLIVSILVLIAVMMQYGKEKPTLKRFSLKSHIASYEELKKGIDKRQQELSIEFSKANQRQQTALIEESQDYVLGQMSKPIFKAWYGTRWNFHGTTETPRKGTIACGYFVSTTLRDAGFRLPRIKMAQQAASVIIHSLCRRNSIKTYNNMKALNQYLSEKPEGLFILGLDKHVGFVLKEGDDSYFIHSSYRNGKKVLREKLNESASVKKSNIKMIGDLTGNKDLFKKWLKGERISVR